MGLMVMIALEGLGSGMIHVCPYRWVGFSLSGWSMSLRCVYVCMIMLLVLNRIDL